MNQEPMHVDVQEEQSHRTFPVDLTEKEFLRFSMTLARKMGTLRMEYFIMGVYVAYAVITSVGVVTTFMQTGQISWSFIGMLVLTVAGAVLTAAFMPSRVKKAAKSTYLAGNQNGYYGEITVSETSVSKYLGDETVTVPLTPQSMYIETKDFMSFSTANEQRTIILPARCMTESTAKAVREAVFSQKSTLNRRIYGRLQPQAREPMPARAFPAEPQTLYTVDFRYNPEAFAKMTKELSWKRSMSHFMGFSLMAMLLGAMMAMLEESIWWFPGVSLTMIGGFLLVALVSGMSMARRAAAMDFRTRAVFTDRGIRITVTPQERQMSVNWAAMTRVVEYPEYVDFTCNSGHLLRLPKRVIGDMEELRTVVDTHMPKKK